MRTAYKKPTPDQVTIAGLIKEREAWRDRAFAAEDIIKTMVTRERFKSALIEVSDGAREDGWKAGVFDALVPQSPRHAKALDYASGLHCHVPGMPV